MRSLLLLIALFVGTAQAGIYRCGGPNGQHFQDEPCDGVSWIVKLEPVNTVPGWDKERWARFRNRPVPKPKPAPRATRYARNEGAIRDAVRHRQVVEGMTHEEVNASWGKPLWFKRRGGSTTLVYDKYRARQLVYLKYGRVAKVDTMNPPLGYVFGECTRTGCGRSYRRIYDPARRKRAPGAILQTSERHPANRRR